MYAIIIEHFDADVSVNGPYESEASARLACYAIAEYEAEQMGMQYAHSLTGSQVGNDDIGEDTMQLYVERMGTPLDTSSVSDVRVGKSDERRWVPATD